MSSAYRFNRKTGFLESAAAAEIIGHPGARPEVGLRDLMLAKL